MKKINVNLYGGKSIFKGAKEMPLDNALNDNMEIKQREMVIKSLKKVSDNE